MDNGQEIRPVGMPTPSPEADMVRQYDQPVMKAVPVKIDSVVYTADTPARYSSETNVAVGTLAANPTPNEVIPADPKLKRVWISSSGADGTVVIGTKEQVTGPNGPVGFALPAFKPMPWEGFREARYAVMTTGGPAVLSLHFEYWAD